MKKSLWLILATICLVLGIWFLAVNLQGCGQQGSSSSSNSSFMAQMAEQIVQQAKNSVENADSSSNLANTGAESLSVAKAYTEDQFGTPDADGWHSHIPGDLPPGVSATMYIRFVYSAGISTGGDTRYWLTTDECFGIGATLEPDYIESNVTNPGLQAGETMTFYTSQEWGAFDYGLVTPSVFVIDTSIPTYSAETKDEIDLSQASQLTGTGAATSSGGTMNIITTGYCSPPAGMAYISETMSGTMTDPSGESHAIIGTTQIFNISDESWIYSNIEESSTLIGIINYNLTDQSGTMLDMSNPASWSAETL